MSRKEYFRKNSSLYYYKNKEQVLEKVKKYKLKHREKIKKANIIYFQKNKDKIYKTRREKYKTNPLYKIRVLISSAILRAIKKNNGNKYKCSYIKYLGYNIDELKAHLEKQFENWMSWDNLGVFNYLNYDENDPSTWTWQIDHIIPQCKFPYKSMTDDNFKKCWALENLRPISALKNLQKNKYEEI